MAKKKGPGGKRKGAGRKLSNPDEGATILVSVTVPIGLVEQLDGMAKERSWNRSRAVTEAIRELVAKR